MIAIGRCGLIQLELETSRRIPVLWASRKTTQGSRSNWYTKFPAGRLPHETITAMIHRQALGVLITTRQAGHGRVPAAGEPGDITGCDRAEWIHSLFPLL
jgi:hypothetical protein